MSSISEIAKVLCWHPVAPLLSLEEAVASWPEYATSVDLTLEADNSIKIIAPRGLKDLFAMVVRRNASASARTVNALRKNATLNTGRRLKSCQVDSVN
ncbi:nucleotidyltransferase family protein [Candidatus Methylospira mobilis]|uniref:nucleotidyltransferase family protein n=1 Tax=Candidatus Methylospira mobilis TaxID=1808979 RepID=UPI001D1799CD|nr:nucleotidyltransferase family protein [Candidatus Methylospira mobilis]